MATAYGLADDRQIIGNDGGYTSAARLSRDSYSLKIGDDAYQFNRLDPLGTLLGMGADVRAYYRSLEGDPEAPGTVQQATEAFVWATTANILSKTWLTSLRNLTDLAGSTTAGSANSLLDRIGQGLVPRFVPASGVQRQLAKVGDQFARQAFDYTDQLHRASLGAGELPQRRDPLLGRPVPLDGLDRLIGLRGGPSASEADDPLQAELERLSFSVPGSQRSIEGVKLTAAQYSRFLELKGQVSVNPKTGLTLDQTLEALIGLPAYRELPDRGRIEAIRDEMKDFTRLASMLLLREDRGLAYKVLRQETYDRLNVLPGFTPKAADAETARLAKELGLAPVD